MPTDRIEIAWLAPSCKATPADILERIQGICALYSDLHGAMLAVLGTHQGLPKEILAASIKQYRAELAWLSREDVASLFAALANGGRQGFDAVLRTRRGAAGRPSLPPSWVSS